LGDEVGPTAFVRPITAAFVRRRRSGSRPLDAAGHRRHVDDRAAAPGEHAGHEGLDRAYIERTLRVEGEGPFVFGAIEHRARVHEAGAVEEHVDRACLPLRRDDRVGLVTVEHTHVAARPRPSAIRAARR